MPNRWPKKWLEEVTLWLFEDAECSEEKSKIIAQNILNALLDIGALKDPPQPREFWITKYRDIKNDGKELKEPRVFFVEPDDKNNWWHVIEVEE